MHFPFNFWSKASNLYLSRRARAHPWDLQICGCQICRRNTTAPEMFKYSHCNFGRIHLILMSRLIVARLSLAQQWNAVLFSPRAHFFFSLVPLHIFYSKYQKLDASTHMRNSGITNEKLHFPHQMRMGSGADLLREKLKARTRAHRPHRIFAHLKA